ncbi:response regulator transcription factor [Nonomuraea sp. NPDC048826]|uniref:response regulator transcription factor n=1 Tax=Nonomuraea sp. NPDC048826 TaxID=3364347 RepID=UPI0037248070
MATRPQAGLERHPSPGRGPQGGCDDSALFRRGVALLLEAAGVEVTGQAGDVAELTALMRGQAPDAVVLDIRMPPTFTDEGLTGAAQLRAHGVGYLLKEAISRQLHLGVETTESHIAEIFAKLDPQSTPRTTGAYWPFRPGSSRWPG